jgi:hypothetical protein
MEREGEKQNDSRNGSEMEKKERKQKQRTRLRKTVWPRREEYS